jgi:glyceraldehyde 3-phosphate dehydrogenase
MKKIAINGMGRIGRAAFKQIIEDGSLKVVAVNDLAPVEDLAYLLKHDSVYGRYGRDVQVESGRLTVNGLSCVALNERSLDKLPWRDLAVDIVLECTGVFTREADLRRHAEAGARYVILSAPVEEGDVPTVVHGVNSADRRGEHHLVRQLHDKLHHTGDRDSRSPARASEGDHDHDSRVYGEPGTRRPAG